MSTDLKRYLDSLANGPMLDPVVPVKAIYLHAEEGHAVDEAALLKKRRANDRSNSRQADRPIPFTGENFKIRLGGAVIGGRRANDGSAAEDRARRRRYAAP